MAYVQKESRNFMKVRGPVHAVNVAGVATSWVKIEVWGVDVTALWISRVTESKNHKREKDGNWMGENQYDSLPEDFRGECEIINN